MAVFWDGICVVPPSSGKKKEENREPYSSETFIYLPNYTALILKTL
jgi:hypothetical protein